MLGNKHINLIVIVLTIVALVFTTVFIISPESLSIMPYSYEEVDYTHNLFNKEKVTEMNISMEEEDWNWIIENALEEEYRKADITINGETFYNVGIRPKGNSSLRTVAEDDSTDRFSFKIKFDKYIKGQNYYGLDKLVVNNMMSDATYMKEYLSYDLFQKMGIATPLYSFTNISINDEPWGLYLMVEATEEEFLERNFGSNYGNLYKPQNTGSDLKWVDGKSKNYQGIKDNAITKITDKDFDKVIKMIENLNNGTNLEEYLDIEEILCYFAVNTLLVNLDSYVGNFHHNYLLYEKDGKFSILPWDLNMSFAGFQTRGGQQAVDFSIDTPYNGNAEDFPLISKLLEVPEYKEIYYNYLEEIVQLYFDSGLFKVTVDKLDNLINEYVKNDATAFYTYEEYTASLPVLKEFGKLRAKSVMVQLAGETGVGTVDLDLTALGSMGGPGGGGKPPNNRKAEEMRGLNSPNDREGGFKERNMGQMMNPENMGEVMGIMEEAKGGELTNSQITRLKELGLDEEAIENFKNRPMNMEPGDRGRGGAFPGGDMGRAENRMDLIIVGICTLVMMVAILWVFKFKRRRYQKGSIK